VSDKTILKLLHDFKALPISSIAVYTGLTPNSIQRRLQTMVKKNMVYSKSIPNIHTKTGFRFFDGYQGMRLFSVNEEDLKKWVMEHLPKRISTIYKRSLTRYLSDIGIKVELPESNMKKIVYISKELYDEVEKKAKKNKVNVSKQVEEILKENLDKQKFTRWIHEPK